MYTLTFNKDTIADLVDHRYDGRQVYGAIIVPYSGVFTDKSSGDQVDPPKILCPYQENDIIAIQERWARSADSYVYAVDDSSLDKNYYFRPAYTMPKDAVRMYGRIVSIKPWRLTAGIARNYLSRGMSLESCAGSAKVVGYYDLGTRMLSKIRKKHNQALLNESSQPLVPENLPMVTKSVPYYLRDSVTYWLSYKSDGGTMVQVEGVTSDKAQVYNADADIMKPAYGAIDGVETLDYYYGHWSYVSLTANEAADLMRRTGKILYKRGEAYNSPSTGTKIYVYIYMTKDHKAIPQYRYYKTQVVDPSKKWFVWMVSAYLCDEAGNIIGDWY